MPRNKVRQLFEIQLNCNERISSPVVFNSFSLLPVEGKQTLCSSSYASRSSEWQSLGVPKMCFHMTGRGAFIALLPKLRTCWPYIYCIFFFNAICIGTNICLFACQWHLSPTSWGDNEQELFFFLKTRIFTYFNPEAQPTPPFTPDLRLCTAALNKLTSYQQDCQATTGSPLPRLSLPLRALLERDNFTAEGHSPQSLSRCCSEATILRNDLLW